MEYDMTNKVAITTSRTTRRKEEKRKNIISKAIELFKQQGFDRTTMEQIAEEADISKGTLYKYFPIKEAIIDEYIQESFKKKYPERLQKLQELENTQSRIVMFINELIEEVQAQNEIHEKHIIYTIQKITSLKRDEQAKNGFELLAAEIIRLGQKSGEIRNDVPLNILVGLIEFIFIQVVQQFYMNPENFNSLEVTNLCVDLCINGAKEATKSNYGKD
jgi:AcrR family transcriptional regulator